MNQAKKSLGQNFLVDKNILEKITNTTEIKNKTILEIGPGTGNLTSYILKKNPKKICVVEKDNELSINLKSKFGNQLKIINDDVLKVDETNLNAVLNLMIDWELYENGWFIKSYNNNRLFNYLCQLGTNYRPEELNYF